MLSATDYMSIVANDINALAGMFERYLICPAPTIFGLSLSY